MKKQKSTSIEYLMPVFRERLACGQSVQFSPQGTSMLPMIRQDVDSVIISPVTQKLRKYDIPLYQRNSGKYILHRIVEAGDTYTCMGDNQFTKEYGLRDDQIIGYVTEFYRNGKKHSTDEIIYKFYCRVWYHSRRFRHFWRRAVGKLKRCLG